MIHLSPLGRVKHRALRYLQNHLSSFQIRYLAVSRLLDLAGKVYSCSAETEKATWEKATFKMRRWDQQIGDLSAWVRAWLPVVGVWVLCVRQHQPADSADVRDSSQRPRQRSSPHPEAGQSSGKFCQVQLPSGIVHNTLARLEGANPDPQEETHNPIKQTRRCDVWSCEGRRKGSVTPWLL